LSEEHVTIQTYLTRFEKNLDVLDINSKASDEDLVKAVDDLKVMIPEFEKMFLGHLSAEESIVFEFVLEHVKKSEMEKEVLPKILEYAFSTGNAEMEVAWFLDSDPAHADDFLSEMPLPPRLLYKYSWKGQYEKTYAPLLRQILYSSLTPPNYMASKSSSCSIM
jgi:hypothetical protein